MIASGPATPSRWPRTPPLMTGSSATASTKNVASLSSAQSVVTVTVPGAGLVGEARTLLVDRGACALGRGLGAGVEVDIGELGRDDGEAARDGAASGDCKTFIGHGRGTLAGRTARPTRRSSRDMLGGMDRGAPSSWLVAGPGLEVVAADGVAVGTVRHVLAAPEEDIFDGLVVDLASGQPRLRRLRGRRRVLRARRRAAARRRRVRAPARAAARSGRPHRHRRHAAAGPAPAQAPPRLGPHLRQRLSRTRACTPGRARANRRGSADAAAHQPRRAVPRAREHAPDRPRRRPGDPRSRRPPPAARSPPPSVQRGDRRAPAAAAATALAPGRGAAGPRLPVLDRRRGLRPRVPRARDRAARARAATTSSPSRSRGSARGRSTARARCGRST